ncbi:hypothetical protein [Aurantibacillus circumpalustris]|uniref:hypothetical protein n=1 Tax=Aurantibacillus circumpalustris TaxID=3036359 RepID=UPI00295A79A4|nr:hypothetical protein [Aurantibacillus circumpalustris]
MKKSLFVLILLFLKVSGNAQLLDTLRDFFRHKYSIDIRLESRNSIISNELTSVRGIRVGFVFKRKLRLGGGISWLKTDGHSWLKTNVTKDFYVTDANGNKSVVSKYLKFIYASYYLDFVFYKTQHWQLSVPIQLGTGYLWFQENKTYHLGTKDPKYLLILYEPGITLQYKLFKWIGAGADITYRFAMQDRKKTGVQLSNLSLTFKALFYFDQLFYQLFPKNEITKKYGPAIW